MNVKQELESLRWTAEQSKKSKVEVEKIRNVIQEALKVGEAPRLGGAEYGIIVNALNDLAHSYGNHIAECAKQIVKIEGDAGIFGSAFEPKK